MRCPTCHNPATKSKQYGYIACADCRSKETKITSTHEFTSKSIIEGRRAYKDDIIQPYRAGQLSKEYLNKYGTEGLHNVSQEEIKNARPVWGEDSFYKE